MGSLGQVIECAPGWAKASFALLHPGAHVVAIGGFAECVQARREGFEIRDTLLVLSPKGVSFAFLLRKPCSEPTVAENVLKHGTGALNIDGARVGTNPCYSYNADRNGTIFHGEQGKRVSQSAEKRGADRIESTKGRWPSNLVLVHGLGCRKVGVLQVKAPIINRFDDGMKPFGNGAGHLYTSTGGGTEEQVVYECEETCLVSKLNEQSGLMNTGRFVPNDGVKRTSTMYDSTKGWNKNNMDNSVKNAPNSYGDFGGASRFFPQFENHASLYRWFERLIGIG